MTAHPPFSANFFLTSRRRPVPFPENRGVRRDGQTRDRAPPAGCQGRFPTGLTALDAVTPGPSPTLGLPGPPPIHRVSFAPDGRSALRAECDPATSFLKEDRPMDRRQMVVQRAREFFGDRLDDVVHMVWQDRNDMRGWQEPAHVRAAVRR